MFGIGMTELIVILVIALLVIGPKKLPDVARSIGKGLREFRNATSGLKDELRMDDLEDLNVEEAVPLGDHQETDKREEGTGGASELGLRRGAPLRSEDGVGWALSTGSEQGRRSRRG